MANGNLPFPFPDAVSQFSVESTALGAQDGMHSGGMVNVVTRSGTNSYHGSAFEFIRNNFLDATNFFSATQGHAAPEPVRRHLRRPDPARQALRLCRLPAMISKQSQAATTGYRSHRGQPCRRLLGHRSGPGPAHGIERKIRSTRRPADRRDAAVGNKYPTPPTFNAQALALQKYLPAIDPADRHRQLRPRRVCDSADTFDNQFVTRVDYTINPKNNLYGRYFLDGYQSPAFFSQPTSSSPRSPATSSSGCRPSPWAKTTPSAADW